MYLHSYQSKVWNKVAQKRWALNGPTPVPGDLVCCGDGGGTVDAPSSIGILTDKLTIKSILPPAMAVPSGLAVETVARTDPSLFSVVLPLPGQKSTYPTNPSCSREMYNSVLLEDGLTVDDFANNTCQEEGRGSVKDALKGAYRSFVVRPQHMDLRPVSETDPDYHLDHALQARVAELVDAKAEAILNSSLESVSCARLIDFSTAATGRSPGSSNIVPPAVSVAGQKEATSALPTFKAQFSLPPGSYATVFIEALLAT
jgi:tRNA(Glu) U13 pseudouridine synthase TruD